MLASEFRFALLATACCLAGCEPRPDEESLGNPTPALSDVVAVPERDREMLGRILEPAASAFSMLQADRESEGTLTGGVVKVVRWTTVEDLLDEMVSALGSDGAGRALAGIRKTGVDIRSRLERESEIREKLLTAKPGERQGVVDGLLTASREDLQAELADIQAQVVELELQSKAARQSFILEMQKLGLDFDERKADNLLATATGDDFVELCVVVGAMRDAVIQLQQLASESRGADAAERYYGVYIVLLKAVEQVHGDFVKRVDDTLLPRLDELESRASALIEQIEGVIARGGDEALGRRNQEANRLTIRAIHVYRTFLRKQSETVEKRSAALALAIEDAQATYSTIELSNQVASMIRDGLQMLQALEQLQLPPLTGFENHDLRQELDRLTLQLGRG